MVTFHPRPADPRSGRPEAGAAEGAGGPIDMPSLGRRRSDSLSRQARLGLGAGPSTLSGPLHGFPWRRDQPALRWSRLSRGTRRDPHAYAWRQADPALGRPVYRGTLPAVFTSALRRGGKPVTTRAGEPWIARCCALGPPRPIPLGTAAPKAPPFRGGRVGEKGWGQLEA